MCGRGTTRHDSGRARSARSASRKAERQRSGASGDKHDELPLLDGKRYAWVKEPDRPAGELQLEERDGRITRIRVLYEQFEGSSGA